MNKDLYEQYVALTDTIRDKAIRAVVLLEAYGRDESSYEPDPDDWQVKGITSSHVLLYHPETDEELVPAKYIYDESLLSTEVARRNFLRDEAARILQEKADKAAAEHRAKEYQQFLALKAKFENA